MKALAALKSGLKKAKKDEQAIASLLDAAPTLLEQDGSELLHWAVNYERTQVVRALAQRGVNLDQVLQMGWGKTALQWAVEKDYLQLLRVLLECGADGRRVDEDGMRPVCFALRVGNEGAARLLLEHTKWQDLGERGRNGWTILATAACRGYGELVSLLLDHGAEARVHVGRQRTPLMLAAKRGDAGGLEVVKALLKHLQPQDINAKDAEWDTQTALHYVCVLVERVAGIGSFRPDIMRAVEGSFRPEIVKALLVAGADPTITDRRGRTPRALAEEDHGRTNRKVREQVVAAFEVGPLQETQPLPPSKI
jgi:ankyrin repeat protein